MAIDVRNSSQERRKHERYDVVETAFAAINSNSNKIGPIIDISLGGLSFKYITTLEKPHESRRLSESSIFLSSMDYYAGGLPFKTVADYEVASDSPLGSIKTRKRHVQFMGLAPSQLSELNNYMRCSTQKFS